MCVNRGASSSAGVVNLYSADAARKSATPAPLRALMSLTTRVDGVLFNHDSQIMAIASKRNKDAFKLVRTSQSLLWRLIIWRLVIV